MKHDVYTCDWCSVPAPKVGGVGPDWTVDVDGTHLCKGCADARKEVIEKVKKQRFCDLTCQKCGVAVRLGYQICARCADEAGP